MRLIAIRHGETEWNVEGREMGQLDSPLTERGREQAQAVARALAGGRYDALYTSDLGRAVATAEAIGEATGLEPIRDEGLRERHMGILQGLTREEMRSRHPVVRAEYERVGRSYVVPDGESADQRLARTLEALDAIAARHPGGDVIVVTHGGVLMGFVEHVLGMPLQRPRPYRLHNASVSVFERGMRDWVLSSWNAVDHLRGCQLGGVRVGNQWM